MTRRIGCDCDSCRTRHARERAGVAWKALAKSYRAKLHGERMRADVAEGECAWMESDYARLKADHEDLKSTLDSHVCADDRNMSSCRATNEKERERHDCAWKRRKEMTPFESYVEARLAEDVRLELASHRIWLRQRAVQEAERSPAATPWRVEFVREALDLAFAAEAAPNTERMPRVSVEEVTDG